MRRQTNRITNFPKSKVIEEQKEILQSIASEVNEKTKNNNILEENKSNLAKQNNALVSDIEKNTNILENIKEEILENKKISDKLKSEIKSNEEKLEIIDKDVTKVIKNKELELEKLEKSIKSSQDKQNKLVEESRIKLKATQDGVDSLKIEEKTINDSVYSKNFALKTLRSQEIDILTSITRKSKELDDLEHNILTLSAKYQNISESLKETTKKRDALITEISDLDTDKLEKEDKLLELDKKINEIVNRELTVYGREIKVREVLEKVSKYYKDATGKDLIL